MQSSIDKEKIKAKIRGEKRTREITKKEVDDWKRNKLVLTDGKEDDTNIPHPSERLKQMETTRIIQDDRIEDIDRMIRTVWKKQDITIKMLTRMGRILEDIERKL